MKFIRSLCRCAGTSAALVLFAAPPAALAADTVSVHNAWLRATAPGQTTAGAYMELTSPKDAALVAAASPIAKTAGLHIMSMAGGVMKMRMVPKIDLPGKTAVKLSPGGLHVMLVGINRPLKEGDKVPLTLTIEEAGGARSTVKIEAVVRAVADGEAHLHH